MARQALVLDEPTVRRIAAAVRAHERQPRADRTGRQKKPPRGGGGGGGVKFVLQANLLRGGQAAATAQRYKDGGWENLPPDFFGAPFKVTDAGTLPENMVAPPGTVGVAIRALDDVWLIIEIDCSKLAE